MCARRSLILTCTAFVLGCASTLSGQVLNVAELNTTQIESLDRNKTVVIIPGGILEQHGPYLPSFSDGYAAERLAKDLAETIVARPGWRVLMFPLIPLGVGAANEIGRRYSFSGSYTVRTETLRAVYMDLADELGRQKFRWVFLVHAHAAPNHNRMLDDAADYFNAEYGGTMVHIFGLHILRECCAASRSQFTPEQLAENGFGVHADAEETGTLLFLRPDLVDEGYKNAPSVPGKTLAEHAVIARKDQWAGYLGAPRLATSALGAASHSLLSVKLNELALKIIDGMDYRSLPRYSQVVDGIPGTKEINRDALLQEQASEKKQKRWLERNTRH